jgi:hypothetical protein
MWDSEQFVAARVAFVETFLTEKKQLERCWSSVMRAGGQCATLVLPAQSGRGKPIGETNSWIKEVGGMAQPSCAGSNEVDV